MANRESFFKRLISLLQTFWITRTHMRWAYRLTPAVQRLVSAQRSRLYLYRSENGLEFKNELSTTYVVRLCLRWVILARQILISHLLAVITQLHQYLGSPLCLIKKPLVIQPLDAGGDLRTKKYFKNVINQKKWQPLLDFLYSIKSMAYMYLCYFVLPNKPVRTHEIYTSYLPIS